MANLYLRKRVSCLHDAMAGRKSVPRFASPSPHRLERQEKSGSHRTLCRQRSSDYVFAFHDADEIGPRMLAKIAKQTGLQPKDL